MRLTTTSLLAAAAMLLLATTAPAAQVAASASPGPSRPPAGPAGGRVQAAAATTASPVASSSAPITPPAHASFREQVKFYQTLCPGIEVGGDGYITAPPVDRFMGVYMTDHMGSSRPIKGVLTEYTPFSIGIEEATRQCMAVTVEDMYDEERPDFLKAVQERLGRHPQGFLDAIALEQPVSDEQPPQVITILEPSHEIGYMSCKSLLAFQRMAADTALALRAATDVKVIVDTIEEDGDWLAIVPTSDALGFRVKFNPRAVVAYKQAGAWINRGDELISDKDYETLSLEDIEDPAIANMAKAAETLKGVDLGSVSLDDHPHGAGFRALLGRMAGAFGERPTLDEVWMHPFIQEHVQAYPELYEESAPPKPAKA